MRRLLALCCLVSLPLAACGGGGGGDQKAAAAGSDGSTVTIGPTTTFMPDCAPMPPTAAIASAVGIPLNDGTVTETGTCQYTGLNDQSKEVTLALLTDPGDKATFLDLQTSLGQGTPLNDPKVPDAMVGPDGSVYVAVDDAIYSVNTQVTGGPATDQVAQSAAVLAVWLGK